jgi:hypothetical protein
MNDMLNTMPVGATAPAMDDMFNFIPPTTVQNEGSLKEFLVGKKWPEPLINVFIRNLQNVPFRYFICDDSGSMGIEDGKIAVEHFGTTKPLNCSRWKELTTALDFHAEIAHQGCIPTEFRFLNSALPFHIGYSLNQPITDYQNMKTLLAEGGPTGATPLCYHINEIANSIRQQAPALLREGKKAVIIIATDGEASDGEVRDALRPLKDLPVWIVLRFCTDEDKIINLWNDIDTELELNMDVLDDFFGEAKEIHEVNPWLTYGEPLHRMREFGVTLKELDKIDEHLLPAEDMLKICKLW